MKDSQIDELYENIDYIRGFKDALDITLDFLNGSESIEKAAKQITEVYDKIQMHHLLNLQEIFKPST